MALSQTALRLSLAVVLVAVCSNCKKSSESDAPPPMPVATETAPPPPPPAVTLQPPPMPPLAAGQVPGTLAYAIDVTKPQMRDSAAGAPDEGSASLLKFWLQKNYPWTQLDAVQLQVTATFLATPDPGRGQRICGAGAVQSFTKTTQAAPHEYEGILATKEGELLSYGAVADVAGVAVNAQARFCGIASGVQTMADGKRAARVVGMFDTPANRGGGGGGGFGSLKACCTALQQNSVSMPPPQNMYAASAASYCLATVASISSPQQKDALLAGIRGALHGAPMPAVCH